MNRTWIVVAREGRARILERRQADQRLNEVISLVDLLAPMHSPSSSAADGRDARPCHALDSSMHMAIFGRDRYAHDDPSDLSMNAGFFASLIADRIKEAHRRGDFQCLLLVAPASFLTVLRKTLTQDLLALIEGQWDRDWVHLDIAQLSQYLQPQLESSTQSGLA